VRFIRPVYANAPNILGIPRNYLFFAIFRAFRTLFPAKPVIFTPFPVSCFVLQPNNYAKQTQFAAHPNERNYCTNNGLSKYQTIQTPEKQTQFQPHHLRSAQPTIKMQNKPNFPNAKISLTFYEQKDYEHTRVHEPRKNKPNQTQFRIHRFLRITVQAFSLQTNSALPFPIGTHKAEGSFADAANNHGFKRSRFRGIEKLQIQNLIIAAIQNLRKLMRHISCKPALVVRQKPTVFQNWKGDK